MDPSLPPIRPASEPLSLTRPPAAGMVNWFSIASLLQYSRGSCNGDWCGRMGWEIMFWVVELGVVRWVWDWDWVWVWVWVWFGLGFRMRRGDGFYWDAWELWLQELLIRGMGEFCGFSEILWTSFDWEFRLREWVIFVILWVIVEQTFGGLWLYE